VISVPVGDTAAGYGSAAVSERSEHTTQGYRRFRCRACGKQFNERSESLLNRTQYPSDVIALVVLWRLRYKLSLRDLPEMFLIRGREAKLTCCAAAGPWVYRATGTRCRGYTSGH
jgi:hypothetical protein